MRKLLYLLLTILIFACSDNEGNNEPNEIGDLAHGGIVIWIDETGEHGLVCALEDQGGAQWSLLGSFIFSESFGEEIGTGYANTTAIINTQGSPETYYVAGIARAYNGGGYTDWSLPSIKELQQMYIYKSLINLRSLDNGGTEFINYFYWSSTELSNSTAWGLSFRDRERRGFSKDITHYVRAVRAF